MSFLLGRQSSFTFNVDPVSGAGTTVFLTVTRLDVEPVEVVNIQRTRDQSERWSVSGRRVRVSLSGVYDKDISAAPSIPIGTTGTVTVTLISGKGWTLTSGVVIGYQLEQDHENNARHRMSVTIMGTVTGNAGTDMFATI